MSPVTTMVMSWPGRWSDRWLSLRDRLLGNPVFRRRAASFVLTRPTARRHAGELFDLVAGFVYSQVLLACVQLRLFDRLSDGPLPVEQLCRDCDLPQEAMLRLLAAAASLDLVERRTDHRYGLGRLGAPMVGNVAVASMVEHHRVLYADLADPVGLLRGQTGAGSLPRYWPYADHPQAQAVRDAQGEPGAQALGIESVTPYTELMAASQPLVADEILDAYDFARHHRVIDVGGGDGTFLCQAARRVPGLSMILFDLPAVAAKARQRFAREVIADRTCCVGGSFLHDELPRGADLATLVRVIHDHDDEHALMILRAVRRALPADGVLLLAEPMSGTRGARAMGDAYFGMYLLAMGRGRPRTPARLQSMLHSAGFASTRLVSTRIPLQTGLIVATGIAAGGAPADGNACEKTKGTADVHNY